MATSLHAPQAQLTSPRWPLLIAGMPWWHLPPRAAATVLQATGPASASSEAQEPGGSLHLQVMFFNQDMRCVGGRMGNERPSGKQDLTGENE